MHFYLSTIYLIFDLIRRKEWNQRAIIADLRHFFNCNIEAWRFSTFTYLASTLGMSPCLVLTELSVFVTNGNCISWWFLCPPIHSPPGRLDGRLEAGCWLSKAKKWQNQGNFLIEIAYYTTKDIMKIGDYEDKRFWMHAAPRWSTGWSFQRPRFRL